MSARRTLKKWDAEIARELLKSATGKDRQQVKVLDTVRGVYRATSMLKRIVTIYNLPEASRDLRIAHLKLTHDAFIRLHAFCKSIFDASWRVYTAEEEAMHKASGAFQHLKRTRKPMEWVWKIGMLPKEEQAHTACVIWWDIFAEREVANRFTPFDKWLDNFRDKNFIQNSVLRKNLISCGYPELVAERRVIGEDLSEESEELETL